MKTLVASLFCLLAQSQLGAQEIDEAARRMLVGLKGVRVIVESFEEDIERDGLRYSQVQTDVELKLRQAGIKVLTQEELYSAPGSPFLYVSVYFVKSDNGLYAYCVTVELHERVSLARNQLFSTSAMTWEATSRVGMVGASHITKVRDTIRDMTDEFVNAYLAANPKR